MRVNGKEIDTYSLDTKQSLLTRIASVLHTLPSYLILPDEMKTDDNKVIDVLKLLRKDAKKSTDITRFLKSLEEQGFSLDNPKTKKEISQLWLSYNTAIVEIADLNSMILEEIGTQFVEENIFSSISSFKTFWKTKRDSEKRQLERALASEEKNNERNINLYKSFENIEDGLAYTEFITERIMLDAVLNLSDITLLEIFNSILLNPNIPFSQCKSYYKIFKTFSLPDIWIENKVISPSSRQPEPIDSVLLKVYEKNEEIKKLKDYSDVKITIQDEVKASVKLITQRGYLDKETFIDRFLSCINIPDIKIVKTSETEVAGYFSFPQQRMNTYVFADLVMNNSIFASLINIDESIKTTKKKSEESNPWLYIHFNHPSTGHVSASIIQKIVDRSDPEMRNEDIEIFEQNQPYIRVRAKGENIPSIVQFQNMLSKLLVIYDENFEEIVTDYKKFIPDFGDVIEYTQPTRKKKIELYAPEVFIKNYSRICPVDRIPTIISPEEAKDTEQKTLFFPRDKGISKNPLNSDGKNQQYYVCNNPDYPFPSLQENKLNNSDDYPFVPCCFKKDPSDKEGSFFRQYYKDEKPVKREKKQQELITTDKILESDQYGILPEELKKIFELIDPDTTYTYIRVGVHRNQSNFLNAVMVALDDITHILQISDEDARENKLIEVRTELSDKKVCPAGKQNLFEADIDSISENLSNKRYYLDPRLYVQLLETYFSCNIFVFDKTKLILPKFTQAYFRRTMNNKPNIFIYENKGSESDHAKYPQCEIIVKWNVKKASDTQYLFTDTDKISKGIQQLSNLAMKSYNLGKTIDFVDFPEDKFDITSQTIDSYGKTRRIEVKVKSGFFGSVKYSVYTDPIPPFMVKMSDDKVHFVSVEDAYNLLDDVTSQTVIENKCVEINGKIGNVDVSIPVKESEKISDLEVVEGIHFLPDVNKTSNYSKSDLSLFNRNKKYSRYIIEYVYWLFSNFLVKKGIDDVSKISDKVLDKFGKKEFLIVPNFEYKNITKNFSYTSSVMKDKKLVITDEDMEKRLLYLLRLEVRRNPSLLLSFHQRKSIERYYVDITDFDQHSNQIILQGDNVVEKWIQENNSNYKSSNSVIIGESLPYFFQNNLVSENMFLAQNCDSLEKAMNIGITWERKGINKSKKIDKTKYKYTLFAYKSHDAISGPHVMKGQGNYNIRILAYKTDVVLYTVLLELS